MMDSLETPEVLERRLTTVDYWQNLYEASPEQQVEPSSRSPRQSGFSRWLCKIGGIASLDAIYPDHQFWNILLPKFLKPDPNASVIEIGVAPATNLITINKLFKYRPFGVEFTPTGAEQSRKNLKNAGFSVENIFECDAFSDEFQNNHQNSFDVVVSLGFIEHFTDVQSVIRHHVNLLKPGGTLVIRIPRLRGANYLLAKLIGPACLPLHNLTIMRRKRFRELFQGLPLQTLYSDYQGSMHLLLADHPEGRRVAEIALGVVRKVQAFATVAMFRLLAGRSVESAVFSPFLLYVGRKTA